MKKTLPTTQKARSLTGWRKHLKPDGKRRANKGTRKVLKQEDHSTGSADYCCDYARPCD